MLSDPFKALGKFLAGQPNSMNAVPGSPDLRDTLLDGPARAIKGGSVEPSSDKHVERLSPDRMVENLAGLIAGSELLEKFKATLPARAQSALKEFTARAEREIDVVLRRLLNRGNAAATILPKGEVASMVERNAKSLKLLPSYDLGSELEREVVRFLANLRPEEFRQIEELERENGCVEYHLARYGKATSFGKHETVGHPEISVNLALMLAEHSIPPTAANFHAAFRLKFGHDGAVEEFLSLIPSQKRSDTIS